jgi:hypothetical protein
MFPETSGQTPDVAGSKLTSQDTTEDGAHEGRTCSLLIDTNDVTLCGKTEQNSTRRGSQIQLKPSELHELIAATSDDVRASSWCRESDSGDSVKTNSSFVTCEEGDSHMMPSCSHVSDLQDVENRLLHVSVIGWGPFYTLTLWLIL